MSVKKITGIQQSDLDLINETKSLIDDAHKSLEEANEVLEKGAVEQYCYGKLGKAAFELIQECDDNELLLARHRIREALLEGESWN